MEETDSLILFVVIASSVAVLFMVVAVIDIFLLYRKRKIIAQQEMSIKEKEIDALIMKNEVESVNALLKGQNTERRRISQELHDRLGSILFTAKLYHNNIESKLKEIEQEHKEGYNKLTGLLDEAVVEVRRISHDLYTGSVANFGYAVALKQLVAALETGNKIMINHRVDSSLSDQPVEIQHEIYAITQELLSNTLKHAAASEIQIDISIEKNIVFEYRDNGKGFDTHKENEGIGIASIGNRVEKLNGVLRVESTPEKGSFYTISIPISK